MRASISRSAVTVVALLAMVSSSRGQGYILPDTLHVPIILYDFHPNGNSSRNGFEQCISGVQTGMLQDTLDSDRKPVFKSNKACNDSLMHWFRPYGSTSDVEFVLDLTDTVWRWTNLVQSTVDPGAWVGRNWADWSASPRAHSMTNLVFYDSLPFELEDSATGTYTFVRNSGNGGFFWLDHRGFGNEPNTSHNFGFTMEMHHQFTYKGDEFFTFSGDDDVWVFINDSLVIDIGGVHSAATRSITLSGATATALGLEQGHRYWFDLFYCERHTSQANCVITTNILTPTKPNDIIITFDPDPPDPNNPPDTVPSLNMTAGQCTTMYTWVVDDTMGLRPDWDSLVHWVVVDTIGNTVTYDTVSGSNRFCFTKAYGCTKLYFSFSDPDFPDITLTDSIEVCIQPGAPHHLVLEAQPSGTNSRYDNPVTSLTIPATTLRDSVYAVLRDEYGNFVGHDNSVQWSVKPDGQTNVTVTGRRSSLGEGEVAKVAAGTDSVIGTSATHGFGDGCNVIVAEKQYTQLRIATGEGGLRRPISSLEINFTNDTLLHAEGLRADTALWEDVDVRWTLISLADPVPPAEPPPNSASQWLYRPPAMGSGHMAISLGSVADTIPVTVQPGGPASVRLYPDTGAPDASNPPYDGPPTTTTRRAGSALPLTAKLFDPYDTWLSEYERDPTKASLFTWAAYFSGTANPVPSSVGVLSATSGQTVSFTPYQSNHTIDIVATFQEGAYLFRDTVRIRTIHGVNLHMVIEDSPDSTLTPHSDRPYDPIQLLSSDTVKYAYAILRDEFGNFARYATSATWTSRTPECVSAYSGPRAGTNGQGVVRRDTTASISTRVIAQQGSYIDSARVLLESIHYTGVRLVVEDGGLRDIDTLRMGADSSITLYVLCQRSDNGQWVNTVPVNWSAASTLHTTPSAPGSEVTSWAFSPDAVGSGRIIVTKASGPVTARDTVWAEFTHGKPRNLVLYHQAGAPGGGNTPYPSPPAVDTLIAGDTALIVAKLFDHQNVYLSQYNTSGAPIAWSRSEIAGVPPTGSHTPNTGYLTKFVPTRAYNTVEVTARFSEDGIVLTGTVRFYVKPAAVTHLVIEPTPLRSVSPHADNPLTQTTIGSSDTVAYGYAILRDRLGNYVAPATSASWASQDISVVTASPGVAVNGEGVFRRARSGSGQTEVIATSGSLRDTVQVVLSNITYDSLRVVDPSLRDLRTLTLRTDTSVTFYALGRRSDNGEWDNVPVTWRAVSVSTSPSAPATPRDRWSFQPASLGFGSIVASMSSGSRTLLDTVTVQFVPGLPHHVVLFPDTSAPYVGSNQPYPNPTVTDTVRAGATRPYAAKVFDHRDVYLSSYNSSSAPISWRIIPDPGVVLNDALSSQAGHMTSFTPLEAYKGMLIEVRVSDQGRTLRDSVRVYVTYSLDGHHLVIEPTPDRTVSPNNDNPAYGVTLSSRDTITSVYAIVRDHYGNWVDYSRATAWLSLDTTVVEAREGVTALGEGAIVRVAATEGYTRVAARDMADTSLTDTIDVDVNDVTYDSLRIVVNAQGLRDIDTLRLRTDQDTLLMALGRRSDNRQWDNVRLPWSSPGLSIDPAAHTTDLWRMSPLDTGRGIISIIYVDSLGNTIRDHVVAIFLPGLPHELAIYPKAGQPGTNSNLPYSPHTTVDTVTAGDSIPLIGKIFDHRAQWLAHYETPSAPIAWRMRVQAGTQPADVLSPLSGYASALIPRDARSHLWVVSEFEGGSLADTVGFYVTTDTARYLYLEASPDPNASPIDPNPITTVSVGERDTIANVYAILRDRFGNFVGYARDLVWESLDTSLVKATAGNTNLGEGRVIRAAAGGGTTFAIARSRTKPWLIDTVAVSLATVSYDSLRIVDEMGEPLDSLSSPTDSRALTIMVMGKRSDNGRWEYVPANWAITSGLSVSPAAPSASTMWSFTLNDTGRGFIWASFDDAVADSIRVHFRHGSPVSLVLYPDTGMPRAANPPYQGPGVVPVLVVAAGDTFPLVAKLFDHHEVWLREYESPGAPFTWELQDTAYSPLTDSLTTTRGYRTTFMPREARRTYNIIARYSAGPALVLADTVRINITYSSEGHHLVLEPDQNVNPIADNPVDTVTMTQFERYRRVYAVVRDLFGNFVGYSLRTRWGNTSDDSIVSVQNGIAGVGEGIIRKEYEGAETLMVAEVYAISEQYQGLSDSVIVAVTKIYFDSLRILRDGVPISSLEITTDDEVTLQVQGLRHGTGEWMTINARWQTSEGLRTDPAAPEYSSLWTFSPAAPDTSGGAWIRVTLDIDSITAPQTLPVVFRRSPPSRVDFQILTPPGERVAGDTIVALVRIRNNDGPLPGSYCLRGDSPAFFSNTTTLTTGDRPRDTVITELDSGRVNPYGQSSYPVEMCFEEGVDTVAFVLYYAPHDEDSLTQLFVDINGAEGRTEPFRLLPAQLHAMRLERYDGTAYGDTLRMRYPYETALLIAMGYDRYGNRRGKEKSAWEVTGNIPRPATTVGVQVFYMISSALDNGTGLMVAQAFDTTHGLLRDSVVIQVVGHMAELLTAVTRDTNGNGMLDRFVLSFNKTVRFENGFDPSYEVRLVAGTYEFMLDRSVVYANDDSTVIYLTAVEEQYRGEAARDTVNYQTGWEPRLTSEFGGAAFGVTDRACTDGAGPVIVSVEKRLESAWDRSTDQMTVLLSEPIKGVNLGLSTTPDTMFNVWRRDTDTSWTLCEGALEGISGLDADPSDGNVVGFRMENGTDLTSLHYFNIRTYGCTGQAGCTAVFGDARVPRNEPHPHNQRVRVELKTVPPEQAMTWPNPSRPACHHPQLAPGQFELEHVADALNWVRNYGGTIISFKAPQWSPGVTPTVTASMKIYDVAGNLVQSAYNPDLFADNRQEDASIYEVNIYWSGINGQGKPVSPGVYRYVLYLDYAESQTLDTKLFGNIGVRR